MRKVELAVMKPWIAKRVIELLGFEDDVLIEYINSLLEDQDNPVRLSITLLLPAYSSAVVLTDFGCTDHRRKESSNLINRFPRKENSIIHVLLVGSPPLSSIKPFESTYRVIGREETRDEGTSRARSDQEEERGRIGGD